MFRTIPQTASANVLGLVLMAALTPSAAASSPTTSWDDWLSANVHRLQYNAESAIILGGAVLYQNRHTIAGVTLGCATGAAVGAMGSIAAGLSTGDAALPSTGPAAAIGCAFGAVTGAQLGRSLDQPME